MSIVNEIFWVTNSLDELVNEGILSYNEVQNLTNSLYFGERYDEKYPDFLEKDDEKWKTN